ncbi:F-actin-uncapping protein LRRC16A-like isoform X2 [Styela clava]
MSSASSEDEITDFGIPSNGAEAVTIRSQTEKKRRQRKMSKSVIGLISPIQDTISLSGTLKRGLKRGPADVGEGNKGLHNALRRELKSSVNARSNSLQRGESLHNLNINDDRPPSPKSPGKWGFSMRKKKDDDSISVASVTMGPKSPNLKYSARVRSPRPDGAHHVHDDTVSMLEELLVDTETIRPEEGIRDSIGRKMTVTLKKMIKLERGQGDKVDAKVLTLTPDRCFVLGVKSPFKVEFNFHFLEIKAMDSPTPDRLNISTMNGKIYFMQMIGTDDADHIIGRVALSLRTIFPGVSLSKIMKASLEPLSRQKVIQGMLNQADMHESGPCGNFSVMYECMCNFTGLPVREEVGWDVDTIYLSQNCKELNFKDFDLPDQKDFIPIILVLMYNRWFEGLVIKNIKLISDVFDTILKVVRRSSVLKQLVLEGVGLKGEIAHKLSQEMIENKECCIDTLDLSNNPLEDRAIMHLSGALPLLKHGGGLRILKLDRTGLSAKGVSGLCQALRSSSIISRSLTNLTLADNAIKGEEAIGLYNYLSTKNQLQYLDVSGTDCAVEIYISAMSKGCIENLKTINLSRNHFFGKGISARPPHYIEDEYTGNRKGKETPLPNTFQEYFKTTKALSDLDLSGMKVPPEAVRQIMDGLAQNFTEDLQVSLNLSSAELKAPGAQMISKVVAHLTNLIGLDISDNGLDSDLSSLLAWIQKNDSIRDLKIGRNFNNIKPKHMKAVMDAIVELVQEDRSCLESLSLCDSKLRDWTSVLLGCLGSNTSLTTLDISGNMIGDLGARVTAKALQINSKIKVLMMDRNLLTANGFHEISSALEKNYTLRYMPYPVIDAVAAMKSQPEKTQASLAKIQDLLLRNANTNKNSNEQQFRLQRAVTTTAQEVLDRVAGKVDDTVNALELLEADTACTDVVIKAKSHVKDAKNSRQLLSDIYGLAMEKTSGDHSNLRRKLEQMAKEMDAMVQEHIKNTVQSMTKNAESQCPHIFEGIRDEIEEKSKERSRLPSSFVKDHVIKQTGTEIINKVSEMNLTVATLISDKVTDTLLAALSQCNSTLTEQLKRKKEEQALARQQEFINKAAESKEVEKNDVTAEKIEVSKSAADSSADETDKAKDKEDQKEGAKPPSFTDNILPAMRQERAASIARRKQRPNSTAVLDLEFKKKPEEQSASTPPRSSSPIIETEIVAPIPTDTKEIEDNGKKEVTEEKDKEPVYSTVNKKKKVEEEKIEDKEEKEEVEEKSEEMVKVEESKEESKEDENDAPAIDLDLPELPTNAKKLEHVTKGRPRPTKRAAPKKHVKTDVDTDVGVDDFFTTSVQSTDFDKVPTLTEEKELAEKENIKKTPKRPTGGIGMMGMPMVTPGMLKLKKKHVDDDKEDKESESSNDKSEEKNGSDEAEQAEEVKSPEPAVKRRPPGAKGLPGMGFGSSILGEMKLKKLNKSKSPEPANHDKTDEDKNGTHHSALPFGPGMLKKTHHVTSPGSEKSETNNNSNDNNNVLRSPPNRWKSKSFERSEKPIVPVKTKSPLMPPKPSPPPASVKPSSFKGNPPPLPNKPKPAALRPESNIFRGARARPMSEFIDPKHVPSSVHQRAASWGKKKAEDSKKSDKK